MWQGWTGVRRVQKKIWGRRTELQAVRCRAHFLNEVPIAFKMIFSQGSGNARKGNERLLSPGPGDQPANCVKPSVSWIFPPGFQTDGPYFPAQRKAGIRTIGNVQFPSWPQGDAVLLATAALGVWKKTNSVEGLGVNHQSQKTSRKWRSADNYLLICTFCPCQIPNSDGFWVCPVPEQDKTVQSLELAPQLQYLGDHKQVAWLL